MGFFSILFGFWGFGTGLSIGLVIGYFIFFFFQITDVENPVIRQLDEQDSEALQKLLPEIPMWVKNPDFDRVDWINKFMENMWPYLDTAICKTISDIAEPIIAEHIPKYKIESVEFKTFTLGSLPPKFQGMKVYSTEEKELIMEPYIKWAGNSNIIVAVKAFGFEVTAQVVDLQVFATPRITLKPLVPIFPCFAKIFVSLMDKPHVDFGLKLQGADLMAIPGLYMFVQDLIKNQVASMYMWPKTLDVIVLDESKAKRRPVGVLDVKVLRATKLRKKDLLGSSDPYIKLKLTDDKLPSKKTTVKHRHLNPEWNEEFNLSVQDPESQALELRVYDWEQVGKHEKMGASVVSLKGLSPNEAQMMTLELSKSMDVRNEKSQGQVAVELTYKPFKDDDEAPKVFDGVQKAPDGTPDGGGLLVVIVHEAEELEGKHHTNPHVRLLVKGDERRTKRVKKNRDPKWEEDFEFVLEKAPINDRLHVEVVSTSSRNILHAKEYLGYVDVGLCDVVNNRRMNDRYHLIDSKNGRIQLELQWRTS